MEYYSVIKNNDILQFASKWTELEKSILTEVTHTQKDKHTMYSLISGSDIKQRITSLQDTTTENQDNKEDPKGEIHGLT